MIEFKIAVAIYMPMRSESILPVAYLGEGSIGPCLSGHTNGTMICPPLSENISVQRKIAPFKNPKCHWIQRVLRERVFELGI